MEVILLPQLGQHHWTRPSGMMIDHQLEIEIIAAPTGTGPVVTSSEREHAG